MNRKTEQLCVKLIIHDATSIIHVCSKNMLIMRNNNSDAWFSTNNYYSTHTVSWPDTHTDTHTKECAITCLWFGPQELIGNGQHSRKIHVAAHFLHHRAILITLTNALSCPSMTSFPAPAGSVWWHKPTAKLPLSLIALDQAFMAETADMGKHNMLALEPQMKKVENCMIQLLDLKHHGKMLVLSASHVNVILQIPNKNKFQIYIISSCFFSICVWLSWAVMSKVHFILQIGHW